MHKLVGLYSSRPQSGKSTIAGMMRDVGYSNVKFAGPLKDMVRGLLGSMGFRYDTIERMVEGDLKEQVVPGFETVTPRKLMQSLGTDWGREAVDKELWLKVGMHKAQTIINEGGKVVIDDVRFPNEARAIREAGGIVVHIIRPDAPLSVGSQRYEALLDDFEFDKVIVNDWSLGYLSAVVANHFGTPEVSGK